MQGSWESSPQIKKERPWVVVSTTDRSRWVSLVKRSVLVWRAGSLLECIPVISQSLAELLQLCTVSSSKHRMSESSPPFHLAQHISPLLEWWVVASGHVNLTNCPWLAREVPCRNPLPSGEKMGGWLHWGNSMWLKIRMLSVPESTTWREKWRKKWKKEGYIWNKWELRQILELPLNATINGIFIKPGEKCEQNLESVNEPFKFSLVLIVDQLSSWNCLKKNQEKYLMVCLS